MLVNDDEVEIELPQPDVIDKENKIVPSIMSMINRFRMKNIGRQYTYESILAKHVEFKYNWYTRIFSMNFFSTLYNNENMMTKEDMDVMRKFSIKFASKKQTDDSDMRIEKILKNVENGNLILKDLKNKDVMCAYHSAIRLLSIVGTDEELLEVILKTPRYSMYDEKGNEKRVFSYMIYNNINEKQKEELPFLEDFVDIEPADVIYSLKNRSLKSLRIESFNNGKINTDHIKAIIVGTSPDPDNSKSVGHYITFIREGNTFIGYNDVGKSFDTLIKYINEMKAAKSTMIIQSIWVDRNVQTDESDNPIKKVYIRPMDVSNFDTRNSMNDWNFYKSIQTSMINWSQDRSNKYENDINVRLQYFNKIENVGKDISYVFRLALVDSNYGGKYSLNMKSRSENIIDINTLTKIYTQQSINTHISKYTTQPIQNTFKKVKTKQLKLSEVGVSRDIDRILNTITYSNKLYEQFSSVWENNKKVLVVAPTGEGKSRLAMRLAIESFLSNVDNEEKGEKNYNVTIIAVPYIVIAEQFFTKLSTIYINSVRPLFAKMLTSTNIEGNKITYSWNNKAQRKVTGIDYFKDNEKGINKNLPQYLDKKNFQADVIIGTYEMINSLLITKNPENTTLHFVFDELQEAFNMDSSRFDNTINLLTNIINHSDEYLLLTGSKNITLDYLSQFTFINTKDMTAIYKDSVYKISSYKSMANRSYMIRRFYDRYIQYQKDNPDMTLSYIYNATYNIKERIWVCNHIDFSSLKNIANQLYNSISFEYQPLVVAVNHILNYPITYKTMLIVVNDKESTVYVDACLIFILKLYLISNSLPPIHVYSHNELRMYTYNTPNGMIIRDEKDVELLKDEVRLKYGEDEVKNIRKDIVLNSEILTQSIDKLINNKANLFQDKKINHMQFPVQVTESVGRNTIENKKLENLDNVRVLALSMFIWHSNAGVDMEDDIEREFIKMDRTPPVIVATQKIAVGADFINIDSVAFMYSHNQKFNKIQQDLIDQVIGRVDRSRLERFVFVEPPRFNIVNSNILNVKTIGHMKKLMMIDNTDNFGAKQLYDLAQEDPNKVHSFIIELISNCGYRINNNVPVKIFTDNGEVDMVVKFLSLPASEYGVEPRIINTVQYTNKVVRFEDVVDVSIENDVKIFNETQLFKDILNTYNSYKSLKVVFGMTNPYLLITYSIGIRNYDERLVYEKDEIVEFIEQLKMTIIPEINKEMFMSDKNTNSILWVQNRAIPGNMIYDVNGNIVVKDGDDNDVNVNDVQSIGLKQSCSVWNYFEMIDNIYKRPYNVDSKMIIFACAYVMCYIGIIDVEKNTPDSPYTQMNKEMKKGRASKIDEMKMKYEWVNATSFKVSDVLKSLNFLVPCILTNAGGNYGSMFTQKSWYINHANYTKHVENTDMYYFFLQNTDYNNSCIDISLSILNSFLNLNLSNYYWMNNISFRNTSSIKYLQDFLSSIKKFKNFPTTNTIDLKSKISSQRLDCFMSPAIHFISSLSNYIQINILSPIPSPFDKKEVKFKFFQKFIQKYQSREKEVINSDNSKYMNYMMKSNFYLYIK